MPAGEPQHPRGRRLSVQSEASAPVVGASSIVLCLGGGTLSVTITPIWFISCTDCGLDRHRVEDDETAEKMRRFHSNGGCLQSRRQARKNLGKAHVVKAAVASSDLARWS
jgi:hypothetical protein